MNIFIQKEPIVDDKANLIAYEIKFKGVENNFNELSDNFTNDIFDLLENIKLDKIEKEKKFFINFNSKMLFESRIKKFPKDKIIIDINSNVQIDDNIINRCKELKELGYSIALNDFVDIKSELIKFVDFIKLGKFTIDEGIEKLKNSNIKLIYKSANTKKEFNFYKELGVTYFKGKFFLELTIRDGSKIKPDELTLFRILSLINKNAKLEEVVDVFKQAPTLSFQLLNVLNSPLLSLKKEINSIRHAIVLLGLNALKKWVMFLIYLEGASGEGGSENFEDNVLSKEAIKRAKYMELLVRDGDKDSAFMTGLLSLIDVALSTLKEEILKHFQVNDDVKYAILRENGILGTYLKIIKTLELENFEELIILLKEAKITPENFNKIQKEVVTQL